jgi:hypothetical protein
MVTVIAVEVAKPQTAPTGVKKNASWYIHAHIAEW